MIGPHFAVGDRVWVHVPKFGSRKRRGGFSRAETWIKASVVKLIPPKTTGDRILRHDYWMYRVKLDGVAEFQVFKVSAETEPEIKAMSPLDRMAEIE